MEGWRSGPSQRFRQPKADPPLAEKPALSRKGGRVVKYNSFENCALLQGPVSSNLTPSAKICSHSLMDRTVVSLPAMLKA